MIRVHVSDASQFLFPYFSNSFSLFKYSQLPFLYLCRFLFYMPYFLFCPILFFSLPSFLCFINFLVLDDSPYFSSLRWYGIATFSKMCYFCVFRNFFLWLRNVLNTIEESFNYTSSFFYIFIQPSFL